MRRRLLLEESNDVPALEPTPDGHIALGVNSMNLKNRLCDVETDRRHSLHGPVLRIRSPTATMAPTCRWRSRPQHHYRTSSPAVPALLAGPVHRASGARCDSAQG